MVTGQRGGNYERMCSKDSMDETSQVDSNKYTTCSTPSDWNTSVRRYAVSYWEQHKVLLRRAFICILRDNVGFQLFHKKLFLQCNLKIIKI